MNPDVDPKFDEMLNRELRQLPLMKAPAALAPRIMAAVRAKAAALPWWLQPWSEWPMLARAALFVAAMLIASILFGGSVVINDQVQQFSSNSWAQPDSTVIGDALSVANTAAVLWQKVGQPLFVARFAVCLVMFLLCAGLGTAMVRVVARENLQ